MNLLKNHPGKFFTGGTHYRMEVLAELKFLIIVALGFTIAFTWRQTTFDISENIVKRILTNIQSSATLSILASTFITLVSLIIILILSKFPSNRY